MTDWNNFEDRSISLIIQELPKLEENGGKGSLPETRQETLFEETTEIPPKKSRARQYLDDEESQDKINLEELPRHTKGRR